MENNGKSRGNGVGMRFVGVGRDGGAGSAYIPKFLLENGTDSSPAASPAT